MNIISNSVLFYNFFVFPFFIGIHLNSSFQFKFLHHEVLRYKISIDRKDECMRWNMFTNIGLKNIKYNSEEILINFIICLDLS